MRYVIFFHTVSPREAEVYGPEDMQKLFERIVQLTKNRAKFAIYEVGKPVADFS